MTNLQRDVEQLNSFLRGELSAVETYDQVLGKIEEPGLRQRLVDGRNSHERRVTMLRDRIRSLGGEPSADSGAWGSLAKAIEGGAKAFGKSAAVSALEEGEDHGLADYQRDLEELSAETRSFVVSSLLPEQRRTHDAVSALQKTL